MRLTSPRTYYRASPPKMPPGLIELMEGLTKEVLKHNPSNVYEFCAQHMQKLLETRDGPSNRKLLSLDEKIARAQQIIRQRAEKRKQEFDKNIFEQEKRSDTPIRQAINVPMLDAPQVHSFDVADNMNSDSNKDNTDVSFRDQVVQSNALHVPVPHKIEFEKSSETEFYQEHDSNIVTQEIKNDNTNLIEPGTEDVELITTSNNINTEKGDSPVTSNAFGVSDDNKMDDSNIKESTVGAAHIEDINDDAITNVNKTEYKQDIDIKMSKQSYDTTSDINDEEQVENSTLVIEVKDNEEIDNENILFIDNANIANGINDSDIHNVINTSIEIEDKQSSQDKLDAHGEKLFVEHSAGDVEENVNLGPVFENKLNSDKSEVTPVEHMPTSSQVEKILQSNDGKDQNDCSDVNNDIDSAERDLENNTSGIRQENILVVEELQNTIAVPETPNAEVIEISSISGIDANLLNNKNDDNDAKIGASGKDNVNLLNTPGTEFEPASIDIPPIETKNVKHQDTDEIKLTTEVLVRSIDKVESEDVATLITNFQIPTSEIDKNNSFFQNSDMLTDSSDTDNYESNNFDISANRSSQQGDLTSNMDLETAAITIQKVFRSFLFKSRASTFEDTTNDKTMFLDEDDKNKAETEYSIVNDLNFDRRSHGLTRMDTVLQTVNEEKSLSLSTDDSSLSSAATIIQAHVRGYLVRNNLNSNKTISTNSLAGSTSNDPSVTSIEVENDESKNKTVLNIHIVPENVDYLSRDESLLTSMDMSIDSPPSSINLHPSSNDNIERRRRLKREDAIQSVSPPSNNSGKLSEEIDSVKEIIDNEIVEQAKDGKRNNDDLDKEHVKDNANNESQLVQNDDTNEGAADNNENSIDKETYATKINSDEKDVVTPVLVNSDKGLIHSGEFHDAVMPTKVSRSDTSVVSEFKNVLVYFLLWNHS